MTTARVITKRNKDYYDYCEKQVLNNTFVILSEYEGLSVTEMQGLKRQLKAHNAESKVLKNKVAKIVFKNANIDVPEELFENTSFFVFSDMESLGNVAKVMKKFGKTNECLRIKGGLLEKKYIDSKYVNQLAGLPSTETSIAKLLMLLNSPIYRLTTTLSAPIRKLNLTLLAIKKSKEEEN
ncbi:MAG: 50S ribosomal protein L10 [bacterium]